jgi:hypothetical protein
MNSSSVMGTVGLRVPTKQIRNFSIFILVLFQDLPVTVAERSKAWIVFAHSEAGIVGSNSTHGVDVWCVFLLSCV